MVKRRKQELTAGELLEAAALMRYHHYPTVDFSRAYMSYATIGKALYCSGETIRNKLRVYFTRTQAEKSGLLRPPERLEKKKLVHRNYYGTLTKEMIDNLTSQRTLQQQAGYTLDQRVAAFNDSVKSVRITRWQLWNLYRKKGIRRKVVQNTKLLSTKQRARL